MTAKRKHSTSEQFLKQNTKFQSKEVRYFAIRNQFISDFVAENDIIKYVPFNYQCQFSYGILSMVGPRVFDLEKL